jgi:hypothetical protein
MEVIMTTQTHTKGGFANNLMAQLAVLAIAAAIVLMIAWRYVW